jgi:hypothetical protein
LSALDKMLILNKISDMKKENKGKWTVKRIVSRERKTHKTILHSAWSLLKSFEGIMSTIIFVFAWNGISYFNGNACSS